MRFVQFLFFKHALERCLPGFLLNSSTIAIPVSLIQMGIFQSQRQAPGGCVGATLCGRLGQALRSDAYVGFREGPLTLVNIAEVSG